MKTPHTGLLLGRAEVEIEAPAERVWAILEDFASYGDWNPFTPRVAVELHEGGAVELVALLGPLRFTERGKVTEVAPGRLLRWDVYPMPASLCRGDRVQRVEPMGPGRSLFSTEDRLTGILAPVVVASSRWGVMRGFARMAEALKRRAEAPAP